MKLETFLGRSEATPRRESGGKTATAALPEERAFQVVALPPEADGELGRLSGLSTSSESAVITKDITPNGTEISYCPNPRGYWVNGVEVPSVTTVLGVLNKPQLVWWGQGRGVQGVIDLFDLGALTTSYDWSSERERLAIAQGEDAIPADEAGIVELLKAHKLTVNHRLDQASERGVNVHDALEGWARQGFMPNPEEFPESERGYVVGLVKFLEDVSPEPMRCEVMVGSATYGYAGRFDLVIAVNEGTEYTSRCYPKRADKRMLFEGGEVMELLVDLKTSKGVYDSHKLQLAAYELASIECGYDFSDRQAVLHVTADGKYELVFSDATPEQFLAVKAAYDALEAM